ncbi:hypothetical protein A3F45_03480 [Candidatus Curtissbacteria bacterium RIFCSPHIGHO2_12_FULL_41_17]|uniref:DUF4190 domain-containing protein n=1 Tax=Candidatus Curtissbacteria bacterium RIFCSPHIGHO2_12_FULL_41_17 TaxID=1797722 RepID=A0A1F5HMC9_9BACT|nr:MAG: hypothetical protein A3F45_03480 [Candidatus Curtissbacteria bacterium RIFCSPHIGHO2_12_FULL_41_17]
MKKSAIIIALIISIISLSLPPASLAIPPPPPPPTSCSGFLSCLQGIKVEGLKVKYLTHEGLVGNIVSDIAPIVLGLAGFIAVIMIIISGIQFMTSSGNPEAAAAARGRLVFALIGFALIVLSYVVLQFVDQLFLGNVIT